MPSLVSNIATKLWVYLNVPFLTSVSKFLIFFFYIFSQGEVIQICGIESYLYIQFSSVTQSCPTLCDPMNRSTPGLPVHHHLPECTQTQRPSSPWCHPAISSSVVPFSSCPQSLIASESFPVSQLFTWGGQSTGVSALASLLPKKSQDWSPSESTGWISLQSKGLSRVFSNTTVQKHQFFGAQLKLSPILTSIHDYWKNHRLD